MFALNLIHGAGSRRFFRAPAQEFRAVAETSSGEMIELHLNHELGRERLPLQRMFGAPTTWTSRRFAGESWRLDELLQFVGERGTLLVVNRRAKTHVIEQAFLVVQTEKQRSDLLRFLEVAEA